MSSVGFLTAIMDSLLWFVANFGCRGLEPIVHPQVYERFGYTAGSDEERAQGIVDAFDDARTTAVICANGGYGCTRLTAFLSAKKLGPHNAPRKRFFGFSDITAIHRYEANLKTRSGCKLFPKDELNVQSLMSLTLTNSNSCLVFFFEIIRISPTLIQIVRQSRKFLVSSSGTKISLGSSTSRITEKFTTFHVKHIEIEPWILPTLARFNKTYKG